MSASPRGEGRARAGQSLVELAVILPLIVLLLTGAVDLGRAFFYEIRLANAVREGALYGAYAPNPTAAVAEQSYAEASGQLGQTGAGGDFVVSVTCYHRSTNTVKACTSPLLAPGDTIEVVGNYTFRPFTAQIILAWGTSLTLRQLARMPIL